MALLAAVLKFYTQWRLPLLGYAFYQVRTLALTQLPFSVLGSCHGLLAYVRPQYHDIQADSLLRHCSWRQSHLGLLVMAAPSYQCLRCDISLEIRI